MPIASQTASGRLPDNSLSQNQYIEKSIMAELGLNSATVTPATSLLTMNWWAISKWYPIGEKKKKPRISAGPSRNEPYHT